LKIYDRIGRLVQTLVDEHQTAGEKSLVWNGTDINNRAVANGVYFLQLEAGNEVAFRKLVIVR
jgi:flagellar hook assembly protein FlgD